jgi:hypothetical protein
VTVIAFISWVQVAESRAVELRVFVTGTLANFYSTHICSSQDYDTSFTEVAKTMPSSLFRRHVLFMMMALVVPAETAVVINNVCSNATAVSLGDAERSGNTTFKLPDGGIRCGGFRSSPALWYTVKGTGD